MELLKDEIPLGRAKNLRGQRFGKLTALYRVQNLYSSRTATWRCQCDCGNIVDVVSTSLTGGITKSCGCYRSELYSDDLTGKRFGRLIAKCRSKNRIRNMLTWICECDCGNTLEVTSHDLKDGGVQSCGCLRSKGEQRIAEILSQNNIPFIREKTFPECRYPDTHGLARFDFYVDNSYLIEFDGRQHFGYEATNGERYSLEYCEQLQKHDNYKNDWARQRGIPLIRVPYYKLSSLTLNDIKLS